SVTSAASWPSPTITSAAPGHAPVTAQPSPKSAPPISVPLWIGRGTSRWPRTHTIRPTAVSATPAKKVNRRRRSRSVNILWTSPKSAKPTHESEKPSRSPTAAVLHLMGTSSAHPLDRQRHQHRDAEEGAGGEQAAALQARRAAEAVARGAA